MPVNGLQRCTSRQPWAWFARNGVVNGGYFGDGEVSYDFTMDQCAHHVELKHLPTGDQIKQVQPSCGPESKSNTTLDYTEDFDYF